MKWSDLCRLCHVSRTFLKYGLEDLFPYKRHNYLLKWAKYLFFCYGSYSQDIPIAHRLRLALQSLGPVWIKLGQLLSTREDLFSKEFTDALSLLQNCVATFEGNIARNLIEKTLGGPLSHWFDNFDEQPLAAASIAQVHTAYLKGTRCEVVLKVLRPGIHSLIRTDINLMYCLARSLTCWVPASKPFQPVKMVSEFEKILLDELDLLREAANALQLQRDFSQNDSLYIPKVFVDYCRKELLVMERIRGIPISDLKALRQHKINLPLLAERGVEIFFTQLLRGNLFHADLHPGNIFINPDDPQNPRYIAIDYGIMGCLSRQNKHLIASNFIAFFNRNYHKIAKLHVASGWVSEDTQIEELSAAIRTVCEPIFQKPLQQISFAHILVTLFSTAKRFNISMQPQLFLLHKTLLYVEAMGRQLYPELDLWNTAKPLLEEWMQEQMSWRSVWLQLKERSPFWLAQLPLIPGLVYDNLCHGKQLQQKISQQILIEQYQKSHRKATRYCFQGGALLIFCSTLLLIRGFSPHWIFLAVAGIFCWMICWYKYDKLKI